MTLRILGAALLALGGLLMGLRQSSGLRGRLSLLEDTDRALALLAGEIEFQARPLPEIFQRLAQRGPRRCRGFFQLLAAEDQDIARGWAQAVGDVFQAPEGEALAALGGVLGRYEGARQAREIELVRCALAARGEEIRREISERAKNYPALGLCAGAAAAILLI